MKQKIGLFTDGVHATEKDLIKFKPSSQAEQEVREAEKEFYQLTLSIMLFLCKNGMPLQHVTNLLHHSIDGVAEFYDDRVSDDWDKEHMRGCN